MKIRIRNWLPIVENYHRLASYITGFPNTKVDFAWPTATIGQKMANTLHQMEVLITWRGTYYVAISYTIKNLKPYAHVSEFVWMPVQEDHAILAALN